MSRSAERDLADLAAAQWGLITTRQAQAAGVTRTHLGRLAAAGALVHPVHGVYALHTAAHDDLLELRCAWLTLDPTRLAATRLADPIPAAVVSHASAAHLHGYGDLFADRHTFTVTTRKQTRRPELRLHRGELPPDDVTVHRGLPVTTPERTVVDLLATHHDGEHVAAVLGDAVRAHQVPLDTLAPRLAPFARRFGLPSGDGAAVLAHLLALGDVTHEVEAAELAAAARMASTTIGSYVDRLAEHRVHEALAQLADHVRRQVEPALAAATALAAAQNATLRAGGLLQTGQASHAEQLARVMQSPSMKAALDHMRSAQGQANLAYISSPEVQQQLDRLRRARPR